MGPSRINFFLLFFCPNLRILEDVGNRPYKSLICKGVWVEVDAQPPPTDR